MYSFLQREISQDYIAQGSLDNPMDQKQDTQDWNRDIINIIYAQNLL